MMISKKEACVSVYDSDLVDSHGCELIGSGAERNGDLFDIYHDPDTGVLFKVRSDDPIDTLMYDNPKSEL